MRSRLAAYLILMTACAGLASGYYHYVHFNSRSAPWNPSYEKFDLNSLPNKAVLFFLSDPGSVQLAPNDTTAGLISQVRAGAKVWNDVAASELRIAFGGIVPRGTHQTAPAIEVSFEDEIPPGIVALGAPQVLSDYNGAFFPIVRSAVWLNRDLTNRPSYGEAFFGTLVHEFGHALGLQHTLTSATMSTGITRASTRAKPLAADDEAGLAVLYAPRTFLNATGTITGTVTLNGQGVNLASVVAISPNGVVISALSRPDGTYRIEAVPPGQYLVYAHPLPPPLTSRNETSAGNIKYPVNSDGKELAPGPAFETQFFPGTQDAQQASPVLVGAGGVTDGIDFTPGTRPFVPLHSVETYTFPAQVAVKPPFLNPNSSRPYLVAGGAGLMVNGNPAAGLAVSILGGTSLAVKAYPVSSDYAQIDVDVKAFSPFTGDGPRHLLFNTPTDVYVLPAGFYQVQKGPPSITGVNASDANGSARMVYLSGTNLSESTRILFDGVAGRTRGMDDLGRLMVLPPPGAPGFRANIVAVNPDGQSSLFLRSDAFGWTYDGDPSATTSFTVTPAALPRGVDAMVTIDVSGMSLVDGFAKVGFGNADVRVRNAWVVGPNRLLVNASVAANAAPNSTGVTLINGVQAVTQVGAFQVQDSASSVPVVSSRVANQLDGGTSIYPGAVALVTVLSPTLSANGGGARLMLNDNPVPFSVAGDNLLSFSIPSNTPLGPALLRLQVGGDTSRPVVLGIDAVPPRITTATVNGQNLDANHGVRSGELVTLKVAALADEGVAIPTEKVLVNIGGLDVAASQITPAGASALVHFYAPATLTSGTISITVTLDGRTSPVYQVALN